MELKNQKIGIVGLGLRTGPSLVKYLHARQAEIYVFDEKSEDKLKDSLKLIKDIPVHLELGRLSPESLAECKTWIVSPGVPCYKPYLVDARRRDIQTISELEFCTNFVQVPLIAITGSNGKSTTTALLTHILQGWKKRIFIGGNFGSPLVEALEKPFDFIVLEVSTFQMELTESIHPKVACVLNVTPNHLDRHGNMATYTSLKEKLLQNMVKEDIAVLNDDDEDCRFIGARTQATTWMFSWKNRKHAPIHVEDQTIVFPDRRTISIKNLNLLGNHNIQNTVAAVSMAVAIDCPKDVIEKQLQSFKGLPHRLENVGEYRGITFFNDAKSSTPESSIQALNALTGSIVYIAGGRSKNASYRDLADILKKKAKKAFLYGECAEQMKSQLLGVEVEVFSTLDNAFKGAVQSVGKSETILYSPANSSFDQYENFEKRGEHFVRLIEEFSKKK
ncbi:MAG: UDP-N-acetylmuramoyl-L-alanine--D-glutamate ligase [Bdellovibrionales bacterium]|nr:UDP-N-acetylmuramoyl-L-alanine--D-glutamate ligase [Bdellovibrionales bacterium]